MLCLYSKIIAVDSTYRTYEFPPPWVLGHIYKQPLPECFLLWDRLKLGQKADCSSLWFHISYIFISSVSGASYQRTWTQ